MIQSPLLLAAVLVGLVWGILAVEKSGRLKGLFHYLPAAFWCYFIPMVLATLGLMPEKSPVYDFLTTYVLSACLLLLLLNINLPAIARLGPVALSTMFVGAVGIALGAVAAYALYARRLHPEMWKGVGALSASWIGGSANMLAVKEALAAPEAVFAPMVIVDTIISYSWMGILVAIAPWQDRWDQWVKADRKALDHVVVQLDSTLPAKGMVEAPLFHGIWLVSGSLALGWLCLQLAHALPYKGTLLTTSGWGFVIVTLVGVGASLTPTAKLERFGASRWGYFCLYLLLVSLGSKARLQYIVQAPLLIAMAYTWVLIHATLLAVFGYLFRIPLFFLATASQANIGGTASTPIVAGVYQPRLAPVGLLLAIIGNVVGTYAGLLIAESCRIFR